MALSAIYQAIYRFYTTEIVLKKSETVNSFANWSFSWLQYYTGKTQLVEGAGRAFIERPSKTQDGWLRWTFWTIPSIILAPLGAVVGTVARLMSYDSKQVQMAFRNKVSREVPIAAIKVERVVISPQSRPAEESDKKPEPRAAPNPAPSEASELKPSDQEIIENLKAVLEKLLVEQKPAAASTENESCRLSEKLLVKIDQFFKDLKDIRDEDEAEAWLKKQQESSDYAYPFYYSRILKFQIDSGSSPVRNYERKLISNWERNFKICKGMLTDGRFKKFFRECPPQNLQKFQNSVDQQISSFKSILEEMTKLNDREAILTFLHQEESKNALPFGDADVFLNGHKESGFAPITDYLDRNKAEELEDLHTQCNNKLASFSIRLAIVPANKGPTPQPQQESQGFLGKVGSALSNATESLVNAASKIAESGSHFVMQKMAMQQINMINQFFADLKAVPDNKVEAWLEARSPDKRYLFLQIRSIVFMFSKMDFQNQPGAQEIQKVLDNHAECSKRLSDPKYQKFFMECDPTTALQLQQAANLYTCFFQDLEFQLKTFPNRAKIESWLQTALNEMGALPFDDTSSIFKGTEMSFPTNDYLEPKSAQRLETLFKTCLEKIKELGVIIPGPSAQQRAEMEQFMQEQLKSQMSKFSPPTS